MAEHRRLRPRFPKKQPGPTFVAWDFAGTQAGARVRPRKQSARALVLGARRVNERTPSSSPTHTPTIPTHPHPRPGGPQGRTSTR